MPPTPRGDKFRVMNLRLVIKKNIPPYSWAWIRQTKLLVINAIEMSIKLLSFITSEAVVSVLGRGHLSHKDKRKLVMLSRNMFFCNGVTK